MSMVRIEWLRENRESDLSNRIEMFICAAEFVKKNRKSRASQTIGYH